MKTIFFSAFAGLLLVACTTTGEPQNTVKKQSKETGVTSSGETGEMTVVIEPETNPVVTPTLTPPSEYKPLVYGEHKELICQTPIPADGDLAERPNLQVMWENYLYNRPEGIWGEIGGKVEVNGNLPLDQGRWTNACTVRLSHMLNKAGHKVPRNGNKTVSGANKDQYYYRLSDMEPFLIEKYGEPDIAITDGTGNSFDLPDTPGIVMMDFPDNSFTGHITVWNGAGTVDGVNIGGYRVLFWNLPCFIPPERNAVVEQETMESVGN